MNNPVLEYIMRRTLATENANDNYIVNNIKMPTFAVNVSKVGSSTSDDKTTSSGTTSSGTTNTNP